MAKSAVIGSGLLIAGQPLLFTKELAVKIGVHNAVFLQQVYFMISRYGKVVDGEQWLRWSIDKWQTRVFPFWSERTLHRIIGEAEEKGWLRVTRKPGATALFAIDYDQLEKEFAPSDRGAKVAQVGGAKVAHLQGCQNGTPRVCQNGTPVPHIERVTALREKNPETSDPSVDGSARRRSQGEHRSAGSAADVLRNLRNKEEENCTKAKEKLEHSVNVPNIIFFWQTLLSTYGFKRRNLDFTPKEKRMVKNFIKMFSNGDTTGKPLMAFLEFVVSNWKDLRTKIVWDNNPKRSRLGDIPTFEELFYCKKDLLHYMSNPTEVQTADQKATVFTDISQVPKTHPKFKQIAYMIQTTGKAVLH